MDSRALSHHMRGEGHSPQAPSLLWQALSLLGSMALIIATAIMQGCVQAQPSSSVQTQATSHEPQATKNPAKSQAQSTAQNTPKRAQASTSAKSQASTAQQTPAQSPSKHNPATSSTKAPKAPAARASSPSAANSPGSSRTDASAPESSQPQPTSPTTPASSTSSRAASPNIDSGGAKSGKGDSGKINSGKEDFGGGDSGRAKSSEIDSRGVDSALVDSSGASSPESSRADASSLDPLASTNPLDTPHPPAPSTQSSAPESAQALLAAEASSESSPLESAPPEFILPESPLPTSTLPKSPQLESSQPNPTQADSASQDSTSQNFAQDSTLDSATPNDATLDDTPLDTDSSDLVYTPLPLQIKPQDILSAHALKDNQQNIALEKTTNNAGFTIIDVYDSAKTLRARLSFKNGALEGISKAYQNGQVAREIPYKNGLVDGMVITYLSPTSRIESAYRAGKKHGRSTIYRNDIPISFKEYQNDILHGLVQAEIEDMADESSKSYTRYQHGKKQGESTGYTDNQVVFRQYYHQSMLQGATQTYGQNEILKISREYKNDLLHGEEIVYNYPQQTPMHKSHYELGVLISPYEIFADKGGSYFSMKPSTQRDVKSLRVTKQTTPESKELWLYDNGQSAMEIIKDSGKTHVRTFYKSGVLASECIITHTQASGSFYAPNAQLESKILYTIAPNSVSKTTWIYAPKQVLLTKSQKSNTTSITQSYKNGVLDSETAMQEDKEITIQKKFFPNGRLEFEHKYIEDKMVQGTLFAKDGSVIYAFPHTSEDMIFDEAFPNTAAKKRAQVFPSH